MRLDTLNLARPRTAAPPPQKPKEDQPSPPSKGDFFVGALTPSLYAFGAASAAVSSVAGYADAFPPGGFTVKPGVGNGIFINPDWDRGLARDGQYRNVVPILAGFSAVISGSLGAVELSQGLQRDSGRLRLAGSLDLGLAAASLVSIANPGVGGVASVALLGARAMLAAHP